MQAGLYVRPTSCRVIVRRRQIPATVCLSLDRCWRQPGPRYGVTYAVVPLRAVAKETRHMPPAFINRAGNDVTAAFLDYARPLVGPLPRTGHFRQM